MQWFRDLKTSRKLAVAFGFLEILMISLGVLSLAQLSKVNTVTDHIVNNSLPKVRALGDLRHAASNMRRDELSFLATVEDKSKWAAAMKVSLASVGQAQQDYERLINSQQEREIYNGFTDAWRKYVEVHNKAMALVATNEYEAGVLARGAGNEAFDNASHFLEQDMDLQQKAAVDAASRASSAYTESRYWVLGLLSFAALAAFVLVTILGRSMSQAISAMLDRIQQIADNNLAGDDIEADSNDEIGQAGAALNRMKNNLAEVIRVIAETSQRVATATEEISSASRETAQGALSQAEQTNQVASAMQEMAATVQQVSENAQKASESSQQSATAARQAGEVADENLATMRNISETTSKVATSISELGQQSEQIGRIAAVIDEIADQTNLLALNAAIEAARAGDQGRGFAVVADEVRKLAERTTAATKEIASMITTIQSGTRSAVETTDLNHQQVEAGVTRTQASGDALRGIIQMSEDVGSMVTGIATAASEQARATEDINHSITQISTLANNSSSSAEQTAHACSNLSNLAVDMQQLVSRFRLKTSATNPRSSAKVKPKAMAATAR